MRIKLLDLLGNDEVALAGSENGKQALVKLITTVQRPSSVEPLFLDFSGIHSATGSFLRESVLGFRDYCRSQIPDLYPVVANASESVLEDLQIMLENKKDLLLTCTLDGKGKTTDVQLIGVVDNIQKETIAAVNSAGEADAVRLAEQEASASKDRTKEVQATKWNNRLAALASKGILVETRHGRAKRYRSILEVK